MAEWPNALVCKTRITVGSNPTVPSIKESMPYYYLTIKCEDPKTRDMVYHELDKHYLCSKVCASDNTILISGFTLPKGLYCVELKEREHASMESSKTT